VKNLTEENRTLGALLRLPYESLASRIYAEARERGFPDIRPAHSSVFRNILPTGSRLTDLAERANMTKQSMAYLVDSLVERDYVTVLPDPSDRRAKLVTVTERGKELQTMLLSISRALEEKAAEKMGRDAMAYLRDLLERLNTAMTEDVPG
jgi:DNA-binding MarR family transcriptional regulator